MAYVCKKNLIFEVRVSVNGTIEALKPSWQTKIDVSAYFPEERLTRHQTAYEYNQGPTVRLVIRIIRILGQASV